MDSALAFLSSRAKLPAALNAAAPAEAEPLAKIDESPDDVDEAHDDEIYLHQLTTTHGNAGTFADVIRSLEISAGFAKKKEIDQAVFRRDAEKLRSHMRNTRRGLINPRSTFMSYWDLVTAIALIYTATITPFEIGIGLPTQIDALFFCNQVINIVFLVDLVLQFFLPVPDQRGELIRDRRVLAMRYLKSWFALDVVSILPFDFVVLAAGNDESTAGLRSFRLMRLLRLIKLVKVLRASRIIQRWQNAVDISSSQMSVLEVLVGYTVFVHWFACAWALLPQTFGSWRRAASPRRSSRAPTRTRAAPRASEATRGCCARSASRRTSSTRRC